MHISENLQPTFGDFSASHRGFTKISPTLDFMNFRVRRIGLSALLCSSILVSGSNLVFAEENSTNSKPASKMEFKNAKEKFKFEFEAYKAALKAREIARKKINETFKASIRNANAEAKAALATATTAEQKLIIMNTLKNARTAAVAIRDAALAALGSLPTPPSKPKKVAKGRTLAP